MADMFTDNSNIADDIFLQNAVEELYNLDHFEEPNAGEGFFPPQDGTEEALDMFHDPLDYEMTSVIGFPQDTATSSQQRQVSAEPLNGPSTSSPLPNLAGPGPEPVKNGGMVPHKPDESFHRQQDQYNQMHQHPHQTQHPHQQPYMDQQCQYPEMQRHHHQHQHPQSSHHHQQHMIHEQQQQMSHMGMHPPPAHPHAHTQHPHLHQHFQTLHLQQQQQHQDPMVHVKSEPNPFVHARSGLTSPSNAMTHEMQALAMGNSGMVGIHPPSVDMSAPLPPTRIPCHNSGEGGAAPSSTSFNVGTQKQGPKATSSQSSCSPAQVAPPIKATTSAAGTRPAPKSSTRKNKLTPEEKEHRRLVRLAARKERKSVREKERRGRENELFEELASLVNMNPEQRDKASILEAVISELANGDSFTAAESEEMREKLRVMMNRSPEGDDDDDDSGSDSESVASS